MKLLGEIRDGVYIPSATTGVELVNRHGWQSAKTIIDNLRINFNLPEPIDSDTVLHLVHHPLALEVWRANQNESTQQSRPA